MVLRSLIFFLYFVLLNAIMMLAFLPAIILPQKLIIKSCKLWAILVVYGAKYILGITFEVKGIPPTKPCIIASKHQSAWETAFFWLAIKGPCFVLKKELMFIPLFGLYLLRTKQIWLNRGKPAQAIKKLLPQVKSRIKQGRIVVIFPEGTRTMPGTKTQYKPGVALLYNNIDTEIIPVRLNSGLYWGKNAFIKKSGKITVEFLPPMPKGLSKQEFMAELEKQIENPIT